MMVAAFAPPVQQLTYVVDLNERGCFRAHVENTNGSSIFEFNNEDHEEGAIWLIEDGYMRHVHDASGLHDYLKMVGLAKPNSKLGMVK